MIELYSNVSNSIKQQAKYWVDLALKQKNPLTGAYMIADFAKNCINEEEKDFIDFYFNLRMEQFKNENIPN